MLSVCKLEWADARCKDGSAMVCPMRYTVVQVWSIEEFRKAQVKISDPVPWEVDMMILHILWQEAASPSHHSQKSYQPLVAMTASV